MKFILIYLLIGVVIAWFIEAYWDELELDFEPTLYVRIGMILFWPILAGAALLGLLMAIYQRGGGNNDDSIGPGYGT